MLEQPENPVLPQCENAQVRSISREVEFAWLAGIIDGEGSLAVDMKFANNDKWYIRPSVRVYNTDVRMIQKIARIYVDLNVAFYYNVNMKRKEHYKNQIGIGVASQVSVLKILEGVMPYLANKQDAAQKIVEIIKYVQAQPKGGNTWHHDYPTDETFQRLLAEWNSAKVFHIDPSTTSRKAGEILAW